MQLLWVFIGSGLGGVFRFLISKFLTAQLNITYAVVATLFINCVACGILGLLSSTIKAQRTEIKLYADMYLFSAVGFCGGLSTFSTVSAEMFELIQTERWLIASIYLLFSIIFGGLSFFIGYSIGKNFI